MLALPDVGVALGDWKSAQILSKNSIKQTRVVGDHNLLVCYWSSLLNQSTVGVYLGCGFSVVTTSAALVASNASGGLHLSV